MYDYQKSKIKWKIHHGKEKKKAIIYFQLSGESSPHQYFFSYEWTHKSTALIECCFLKSWGALLDSTSCSPSTLEPLAQIGPAILFVMPCPVCTPCPPLSLVTMLPGGCLCIHRVWLCSFWPCCCGVRVLLPWGGLMAQRLLNEVIPCFSAECIHPQITTLQKILANEILTTLLSKIMLKRVVFLWLVFVQ